MWMYLNSLFPSDGGVRVDRLSANCRHSPEPNSIARTVEPRLYRVKIRVIWNTSRILKLPHSDTRFEYLYTREKVSTIRHNLPNNRRFGRMRTVDRFGSSNCDRDSRRTNRVGVREKLSPKGWTIALSHFSPLPEPRTSPSPRPSELKNSTSLHSKKLVPSLFCNLPRLPLRE